MKNIVGMETVEALELLHILANDQIFAARERLVSILNEPLSPTSQKKLKIEFREFYCGYESLAFFLETYKEDPLKGLSPHIPLAKKLKRQREYILANRKTTAGLELRPEVLERLEKSVADIEAGGKTYSLEEVFGDPKGV